MDKRRKWIWVLLEEGLRLGIIEPADILRYATPAVLATDLPPLLVARVLQAGINKEAFSPDLVVNSLGSESMAEHLPLPILWECLDEAAGVIVSEHPLSQHGSDLPGPTIGGGQLHADDVPEIEVLEG